MTDEEFEQLRRLREECCASLDGLDGGDGYARVTCPACPEITGKSDHRQSLSLNRANGWYGCFKCAIRGRLDGYEDEEGEGLLEDRPARGGPTIPMPDGFHPLYGEEALTMRPFRDYLARRRVPDDAVRVLGIGACVSGRLAGRVVVPILRAGLVIGWVARAVHPRCRGPKYLAADEMPRDVLMNEEALFQETFDPAILVEGPFDALPHWPRAVAQLGKLGAPQWRALRRSRRPVVTAADGDDWEAGHAIALRLALEGVPSGAIKFPPGIDPGDVDADTLAAAAEEALDRPFGVLDLGWLAAHVEG